MDFHCYVFFVILLCKEKQDFCLVDFSLFYAYRLALKCFCQCLVSFFIAADSERNVIQAMIGSLAAVSFKEINSFAKSLADLFGSI